MLIREEMDRKLGVALGVAVAAHVAAWAAIRPSVRRDAAPREVAPVAVAVLDDVAEIEPLDGAKLEPLGVAKVEPLGGAKSEPLGGAAEERPAPKIALRDPPPKPFVAPHAGAKSDPASETIALGVPAVPAPSPVPAPSEPAPKSKLPSLLPPAGQHGVLFPVPAPGSDVPKSKEEIAQAKLDAQLAAALDAKAAVNGGGSGGPVVSAAHGAALGSNAPDVGSATFDVFTDATGAVTAVKLVSFSADELGWKNVESALRKALATTRLKVPTGAQGVLVRVNVDAAMKLPSGAKSKLPGFDQGTVTFDVSDWANKPKRVVAVRVVFEQRI